MPSSHGTRRKSRSVLTKSNKVTGISYLLINYRPGDKVVINIDPSEHTTMPHRRFQGRVGTIESIGRRTMKVMVMFGNKQKFLQTKFNHIRQLTKTD
jgi:large subunit ribosomal protein L21e